MLTSATHASPTQARTDDDAPGAPNVVDAAAVLLQLQAGVVVVEDQTQRPLFINEAACAVLNLASVGLTRDAVLHLDGMGFASVLSSLLQDAAGASPHLEALIDAGVPGTHQGILMADGRILDVEYAPIVSARALQHLWVFRDVTASRDLEEDLRSAEREAVRAAEAKTHFLSNMSHELRTPLNGIIGMTELSLDTELSGEQREYLGAVSSAANHLLKLINDILDFSKLEAARVELRPTPTDLHELVVDTLRVLGPSAYAKGLDVHVTIDDDLPERVVCDGFRVRQVLANLFGNAVKFTDRGQVAVTVSRAPGGVAFAVHDTGMGIAEADQALVFERFTRVEGPVSERREGAGLGLAICRQLVELLGGALTVQSQPGVGSTFRFTIAAAKAPGAASLSIRVAAQASLVGRRALVVEQNGIFGVASPLQQAGLHVVTATSLAEVGRILNGQARFDVIACDDAAVGARAAPLLALLDGNTTHHHTPLIVLSRPTTKAGPSAKLPPHARMLLKPYTTIALLECVRDALGHDDDRGGAAANAGTASLRILVAEDEPISARVTQGLLSKLGHHVTVVDNGIAVQAAMREGGFDVVFTDLQMPGADGFEVARAFKAGEMPASRGVALVALTARVLPDDVRLCEEAGFDAHLSKPVRKVDLDELLRRLRPSPVHFEPSLVLSQLDGDEVLLHDVLSLFLKTGPVAVERLRKAQREGDAIGLRDAAHRLRGTLLLLSPDAAERALRAEGAAERGRVDDSRADVAFVAERVAALLPGVRAALAALTQVHPTG